MAPKSSPDFDIGKFISKDTHEKDMQSLSDRLLALEEKLGDTDKVDAAIKKSITKNVYIQNAIKSIVTTSITSDVDVNKHIKSVVNSEDRDYLAKTFKRFGLWILGGIIFLAGVIVTAFITKLVTPPVEQIINQTSGPINNQTTKLPGQ